MSVYKPPNSSVYLYDFQLKGNRFHGSTGQKSKRAAEQIEAQKRLEAASNEKRKPPITIDDAAGLYEDKLRKEDRWSASTETWLLTLVTALGPRKFMSDIQHTEIGKYLGIIYLTPDYSSGSYLLMQRAIPP